MKKSITLLAVLLFTNGCVVTKFEHPTLGKVATYRLLNKTEFNKLSFVNGTNSVTIDGYKNDQVQAVEAAASGAIQGLIKSGMISAGVPPINK